MIKSEVNDNILTKTSFISLVLCLGYSSFISFIGLDDKNYAWTCYVVPELFLLHVKKTDRQAHILPVWSFLRLYSEGQ